MDNPRIVIAGAGSIGCFVGGLLTSAGKAVSFLARQRIADELTANGLHLTDLDGLPIDVAPEALTIDPDPALLREADIVLVTVKSGATAEMAKLVREHAPTQAVIVSLQNGVGNAAALRQALPGHRVLAGMVPFNVLYRGEGRFHRGTSGSIVIEDDGGTAALLTAPHLPVEASGDMAAVLWGKLLLNLNNALNALAGVPLQQQLLDRRWRRLLAGQQAEALRLLRKAGIRPWSLGPLPVRLLPWMLRLPTPLFKLASGSAVRIDPLARSSMWEDLERRRPTEVDELQGAVVALARRLGEEAPRNLRILELIREAERASSGSPRLDPAKIR